MSIKDYYRMVETSYKEEGRLPSIFCNPNVDPDGKKDPWPLRPWPAGLVHSQNATIQKLNKLERYHYKVRGEDLNLSTMMGVSGGRTRGQVQVMGNTKPNEVF
jgi:hypothetical protein